MTKKKQIIAEIIAREGGYVDHPDDSGGPTRFGITQKVARQAGYSGPMRDFPRALAESIYVSRYWDVNNLDTIEKISPDIAYEVADTGVLCGPPRAARFMQRSLNVLNRRQRDFPDLVVDGLIGKKTVGALRDYVELRGDNGERVLLKVMDALQAGFLVELAERREKDERFLFGWILRRTHA